MGKSYRYPIFKDEPDKYMKRLSNKKIRKWLKKEDKGFKSKKQFKHQVDQYDIVDWRTRPQNANDYNKAKRK
jgi:hypothetical protein